MNNRTNTVARDILDPKLDSIILLKALNGIFGNWLSVGAAEANENRFHQIKSQINSQKFDNNESTEIQVAIQILYIQ